MLKKSFYKNLILKKYGQMYRYTIEGSINYEVQLKVQYIIKYNK